MFDKVKGRLRGLTSDGQFAEILTGSAWALGAKVSASVLALATSAIVARVYGPETLGTLAVISSFLTLVTLFTVLGTNTSILRLIPEHLAKYSPSSAFKIYRKTQYFVAAISVVTASLLYCSSGFVAEAIFDKPYLKTYFALMAGFVVFKTLMLLNTNAVRGLRLFQSFAFMQLLPGLCNFVILILLTLSSKHHDNPIFALLASIGITAIVGGYIMDRAFKRRCSPTDPICPIALKSLLSISMPMLMTALMTYVIGQTGVIMLGILRPEEEVGYYAVAVQLASLTAFMLQAVNTMATPKYSELFHSNKIDELINVAQKTAKLIFWVAVPLLLILLLSGKFLLIQIYGAEFAVAYGAMIFLVVGQLINAMSGSTGPFMNMTNKHRELFYIKMLSAILNILLNTILIPKFGILGSAISAMISILAWNLSVLLYIKAKHGKSIAYIPFVKP